MGFFENNRLVDLVKEYFETRIELIKMDIDERVESVFNRILSLLLIAGLWIIGVFLFLFGISVLINQQLNSEFLGYLITGGTLMLLGALFLYRQKK